MPDEMTAAERGALANAKLHRLRTHVGDDEGDFFAGWLAHREYAARELDGLRQALMTAEQERRVADGELDRSRERERALREAGEELVRLKDLHDDPARECEYTSTEKTAAWTAMRAALAGQTEQAEDDS